MASELAAGRGLSGVRIVTADARRTGLPPGSFDLVHARTLLITVPQPVDAPPVLPHLRPQAGRQL